jgi:hypothetical protein
MHGDKDHSLRLEAYERLRAARRYPDESFSQVILRARWPEETITAGELLRLVRQKGARLSDETLERIESLERPDLPPADKWARG